MEPDAELLERWGRNDRVAGNALFQRYFPAVHRFFVNKVSNAAAVEDLVQQTFALLAECATNYRGTSTFRTFVFGVAHNVLRAHIRTRVQDNIELIGDVSVADLGAGPSSVAAAHEELRLLLDALQRVPIEKQVVLELYYFEELTGTELAAFLDVPESTARSRLRLSLGALRKVLAEQLPITTDSQNLLVGIERWIAQLQDVIGTRAARS